MGRSAIFTSTIAFAVDTGSLAVSVDIGPEAIGADSIGTGFGLQYVQKFSRRTKVCSACHFTNRPYSLCNTVDRALARFLGYFRIAAAIVSRCKGRSPIFAWTLLRGDERIGEACIGAHVGVDGAPVLLIGVDGDWRAMS